MLLKSRFESEELLRMRYLNTRMELTPKEKLYYLNLEKGFEGEVNFDLKAECLNEERYILNDLQLVVSNSFFQIDTLIISQGVIHLLNVKNYEEDFYIDGDKLYAVSTGREYQNPVNQLNRSATLFRQLLQNLKQNYLIEATAIFINPEFTLYQAPMDQPFILPTQVNRFLNKLNKTPSKLNDGHKKLAQKLLAFHQTKSPHSVVPDYNYDRLQKGHYCKTCKSFEVSLKNNELICEKCGEHEEIEQAILRDVKELKLLFPEQKITTQSIYEWCKLDLSKKTICRILKKNYTAFGNTRDRYYE